MGKTVITHEKLEDPESGNTEYLSFYTSMQTLTMFWINAMSALKGFE